METDLLPSASVFAASLVLFFYASLLHHYSYAANLFTRDGRSSHWLLTALTLFKYGCVMVLALSGLAVVSTISGLGWWTASFSALGLLVLLAAIDRITAWSGIRTLHWTARWLRLATARRSRAVAGFEESGHNGSSRGFNTDDSYNGDSLLPEEPALTEEELINLDMEVRQRRLEHREAEVGLPDRRADRRLHPRIVRERACVHQAKVAAHAVTQ